MCRRNWHYCHLALIPGSIYLIGRKMTLSFEVSSYCSLLLQALPVVVARDVISDISREHHEARHIRRAVYLKRRHGKAVEIAENETPNS